VNDVPTLRDAIHVSALSFAFMVLIGALSLVIGVVANVTKRRGRATKLGGFAIAGALAIVGIGAFGRHVARTETDDLLTVGGLSESVRGQIRALGYEEADYVLWFGVAAAALPLGLGAVAVLRARGRAADT